MTLRTRFSHLVIFTSVVAVALTVLCAQTACSSIPSLCKPTSRTAGVTILSAWCERYTQCDKARGTVDECVVTRLAAGQVPSEDGCAESCSEDTGCRRSSCNQEKIDKCKTDSFAMKCEEQVSSSLIRFPFACDSCFN